MSEKTKKGKMGTKIIFTVIVIALVVLLLFIGLKMAGKFAPEESPVSGLFNKDGAESFGGFGKEDDVETVFAVNVVEAVSGQLVDYIDINGDVVAESSVDVYPEILTSGKLVRNFVELGDYVVKGQTLAEIDPSRPGQTFAKSPVKAPISGTVTYINDNIGATFTAQIPVATIGDLSDLQLRTYIPERFISKIGMGMTATFSLEAYPGEEFTAVVTEISPVVDTLSRTLEIKLNIAGGDPRVKSGMFAKIRMVTEVKDGVIKLPSDCVLERFGENIVYVVNESDMTAEKRVVTLGIQSEGTVEILSGLTGGETVVYQGQTLLADGAMVNIKNRLSFYNDEDK